MEDAASSQKICTVCGQDCSGKPRTKDSQGRYVCKECMQRAQSAQLAKQDAGKPKAAPAPAAGAGAAKAGGDQGDNAFLLDIAEPPKVREDQTPCPSCGKGVNEGQVLCTSCGFNLKTGNRTIVNVLKPVELRDKTERNRSGGLSVNIPPAVFGVVPLLVIGGMMFGGAMMQNEVLFQIGLVSMGLFVLVAWVSMIVDAFRTGESGWGLGFLGIIVLNIVSRFLPFRIRYFGFAGFFAVLYYLFVECESPAIKWMMSMAYVLAFIAVGLVIANAEWIDSLGWND